MYQWEPDLPLNYKIFCKEYFTNNNNGLQAAIKAGFAPKNAHITACRLLKKSNVQEYLRYLMEQATKEFKVTRNDIADLLWYGAQRSAARPGGEHAQEKFKPTGLVDCISELNKMQGNYPKENESEKGESTTTVIVEIPSNNRANKNDE